MTIYLDVIFLENLFMNFTIIYACQIILKLPTKIVRTFLSSLLGSIYAIISYTSMLSIYSNIFLKITLSIAMVYIAFNPKNVKSVFKYLIVFYLTSFTFGGVAFFFLYFINPEKILLKKGVLIGTYPIKIVLAGGIFGFILITYVFKIIKCKITKKDMNTSIKIYLNNQVIKTNVIIDTGNFLKDPITKTPVIVIEKNILKGSISKNILDNLEKIIVGEEIDLGEYKEKIRIIPYTSLGKQNGILLGIKINKIEIMMEENVITKNNIIVGIYDGILSRNGKYHGLIGLDIIEKESDEKSFNTI